MSAILKTKSKLLASLAAALLLGVCASAQACVHTPRTYKGTVTEKTKEALLFNDGVNTHLIIRTNLQASSGALPDTMAWVIPLPALPSHYEETDPGIFPELFRVAETAKEERESHLRTKDTWTASVQPMSAGILVHPMQTVGSYQVQPIEVLDPKNAGSELNSWLLANGFGAVPPANQQYYLKRGNVFLTLKLHGLKGSFSDVKPLHIVYKSDALTLPLKFSSHSGVFNVEMYAFTPRPLDTGLLAASDLHGDRSVEIKDAADAPRFWRITGQKHGFLTRFEGYNFNGSGVMVKDLKADPIIDLRKNNGPSLVSLFENKPKSGYLGIVLAASAAIIVGVSAWHRKKRAISLNSFQKP